MASTMGVGKERATSPAIYNLAVSCSPPAFPHNDKNYSQHPSIPPIIPIPPLSGIMTMTIPPMEQQPFYTHDDESSFFTSDTSSLFDAADSSLDTDVSSIHSSDECFAKSTSPTFLTTTAAGPSYMHRMPTSLLLPPQYKTPRYTFHAELHRNHLPVHIQRYLSSFDFTPPTHPRTSRTAYIIHRVQELRNELEGELGLILEEGSRAIVRLANERRALEDEMASTIVKDSGSSRRLEICDRKQLEAWRIETARHVRGAELLFADRVAWVDEYLEKFDALTWLELKSTKNQPFNDTEDEQKKTWKSRVPNRRSSVSTGVGRGVFVARLDDLDEKAHIESRRQEFEDMVMRFDGSLVEDMRIGLARWDDVA